jgi:hypothetical protein
MWWVPVGSLGSLSRNVGAYVKWDLLGVETRLVMTLPFGASLYGRPSPAYATEGIVEVNGLSESAIDVQPRSTTS